MLLVVSELWCSSEFMEFMEFVLDGSWIPDGDCCAALADIDFHKGTVPDVSLRKGGRVSS